MYEIKPYIIDLSAQMAVCDANYIRLLQIFPELSLHKRRDIVLVSHQSESSRKPGPTLTTVIEVTEQFKYTASVRISQQLEAKYQHYCAPEMLIRVYHDAKTAEVISYQQHRYFKACYPLPNPLMYQADEKEQLNFFLAEWLGLCQKEGLYPQELLAGHIQACLEAKH